MTESLVSQNRRLELSRENITRCDTRNDDWNWPRYLQVLSVGEALGQQHVVLHTLHLALQHLYLQVNSRYYHGFTSRAVNDRFLLSAHDNSHWLVNRYQVTYHYPSSYFFHLIIYSGGPWCGSRSEDRPNLNPKADYVSRYCDTLLLPQSTENCHIFAKKYLSFFKWWRYEYFKQVRTPSWGRS